MPDRSPLDLLATHAKRALFTFRAVRFPAIRFPGARFLVAAFLGTALLAAGCEQDALVRAPTDRVPDREPHLRTGIPGASGTLRDGLGRMPDFSLPDVNPNSATSGEMVSPRQFRGRISAWYFGAAT
jgi:hypothetical protein